VLDWGFQALGLNRIHAYHFAGNHASGRVMQKIGMKHEGTLRQHLYRFGEAHDVVCYGILHSEWKAMQATDDSDDCRERR
jgi:RimJ/RimL family protein N-acetyltransferase